MEIKINCVCGQPFKFNIEPLNGLMPCAVNCPGCGNDATAQANLQISRQLAPPAPPVATPPAPRPATYASVASPPVSRPYSPAPTTATPPVRRAVKPKNPEALAFRNGLIGASVAAAVGLAAWFSMTYFWHLEFGWAAWLVGAMVGVGALMGGEGSSTLGALCSLLAAVAILGGHFLGSLALGVLPGLSIMLIVFLILGVMTAYKFGSGGSS